MSNAVTKSVGGIDLDLDLGVVGRALWRRRNWVIFPLVIVCGLTFVGVNMVTPRYKSEARVLVEGRENVFLRPDAEKSPSESLVGDQEAVVNQVQVALSRDVALDVIRKLKLAERPEFDPMLSGTSFLKTIQSIFSPRDPSATGEEHVLEAYYERLTVFAVEHSRVVVAEFQSADPDLAAQVANAVAEAYIARQRIAKQDQSNGASQWLAGEIEKLRGKVAEAEARVEAFRAKSNLTVGPNNTTLSSQQLSEVNSQLSAARGQRADAEARAKSIREQLRKGGAIEASDVGNSDIIRRLSEQRATFRAQLAEQSATLLDGHPRIKELKAQIADVDAQIRIEAEKLVRTFENDARQASARFDALSTGLDGLKQAAGSNSDLDVQLRALEREAKAQRELLESYLSKYRESTARESIASAPTADVRIISRAIPSKTPYFPKKLPTVLVAALATLLLSCGVIVTGEVLTAPAAGRVEIPPTQSARIEPSHPALGVPISAIGATARRILETAKDGRRVAVLGPSPGEMSLAALTFARALCRDKRVVLVSLPAAAATNDGLSGLAVVSSNPRAPGLSDVVRGRNSIGEAITRDRLSNLHLVAAGNAGGDAAALMRTVPFLTAIEALARSYDIIVVDAGAVTEAMLPRVAEIAPRAVLIAPQGSESGLRETLQRLSAVGFRDVSAATAPSAEGEAIAA